MLTLKEVHRFPLLDIHRHSDGDTKADIVGQLAERSGISLPVSKPSELSGYFAEQKRRGLPQLFTNGFGLVTSVLQTRENLETCAYEELRNCKEDGIIYTEVRFAPAYHTGSSQYYHHDKLHLEERLTHEDAIAAMAKGLKRGEQEFGVKAGLIVCINREAEPEVGRQIAQAAISCGVAGIDLACDEATYPPERHKTAFELTFGTEVKRTVHAGEFGPQLAENIRTAITELKADRLGHARPLSQNPDLLAEIRKKGIGIESCPESNIFVGLVASRNELGIGKLLREKILVTVNSDDPAMFGYTLSDSISRLSQETGIGAKELKQLELNAAKVAFLPEEEKTKLEKRIEAGFRER